MEDKYRFLKIFMRELARRSSNKGRNEQVDFMCSWKMPTTWVMKMLYFTLLQITNDTGDLNNSFVICDNYEAWKYGPVEVDAYKMIKEPFHEFSIYRRWEEQVVDNDGFTDIIQNALDELYINQKFNKLIKNTDSLIILSHNLYIWPYTVRHCLNEMAVNDINIVRMEIDSFYHELDVNFDMYLQN